MADDSTPVPGYLIGGVVLGVAGMAWAAAGPTSKVVYVPVQGISVFAVLYVVAQAAERITEWVIDLLSLRGTSPEVRKQDALLKVRKANSTLNGNPTVADLTVRSLGDGGADNRIKALVQANAATAEGKSVAEKEVATARRDITFLAHGLSIALCALAVTGVNYGLLGYLGAKHVNGGLDRLITALAAAGGTKALHELIGRFQSTKESAEAGKAT